MTSNKAKSSDENNNKRYNLFHVAKTKHFNAMAVLICLLWVINSLVYYGLSLNTADLPGDRFVNFFISGAVELPAYTACIFTMKYIDRRRPCSIFHIIAGIPLFVLMFVPYETQDGTDLSWLHTTLTMIGKFGITASFSAIYLQTIELYPTVVRNAGLGISSTCARIGGMLAPYTIYWAKTSIYIQPIIFGLLAILAGVIVLALPETKTRTLPETLEDVSVPWFNWFGLRKVRAADGGERSNNSKEMDNVGLPRGVSNEAYTDRPL